MPAIRVRGRQRGGWCESIEMKGRWEGGDERAAWRERVTCRREQGGREGKGVEARFGVYLKKISSLWFTHNFFVRANVISFKI